ncbi:MATE family efflux transporter [Falsiroseomonas sp. HW251]|uniref:MATE family efflux transporter n=1 Tax=Falsiroseomonas sp. HW251 TaxID=3390998 RepID=UPI003D31C4D7
MNATGTWRAEFRATLLLAWPLVLTNLSQFALTLTDTIFLGHVGTQELAAATLGMNLVFAAIAPCFGLATAAAATTAQTRGRGPGFVRGMRRDVRAALWATALSLVPFTLAMWQAEAILLALGQDPVLAALAGQYVRALLVGEPFFLGFVVLRGFLAAEQRPGPAMAMAGLGIALNVPLNAWLIFGGLGLPPLGVVGAGLASSSANAVMLLGLLAVMARDRRLRRFRILGRFWRPDMARLRETVAVGLPIAGSMLLEIGIFASAALLMGWLDATSIAAHAIAVQCATVTFMVPMGIGQAATARVGLAAGAGDAQGAARAGWAAIALGVGFMAGAAVALIGWGEAIARLFLDAGRADAAGTAALAATLLVVAGLFQLADGVQAVASGALRGLKDTTVPMLLTGIGYWVVGLPLGLVLAFPMGLGAVGIWVGLAAGVMMVAVLLMLRWIRRAGLTRGRAAVSLPA